MGYENMDFVVTDVNYVVERPHTASWAVKNICFEQNYVMAFSADGFVTYETDGKKTMGHTGYVLAGDHFRHGLCQP